MRFSVAEGQTAAVFVRSGSVWVGGTHSAGPRQLAVLALADKFTLNDWPGRPLFRTVALAQAGRIDEAANELDELRKIEPDFARDPEPYIRRRVLFDDQASYVIDGLKKAGM